MYPEYSRHPLNFLFFPLYRFFFVLSLFSILICSLLLFFPSFIYFSYFKFCFFVVFFQSFLFFFFLFICFFNLFVCQILFSFVISFFLPSFLIFSFSLSSVIPLAYIHIHLGQFLSLRFLVNRCLHQEFSSVLPVTVNELFFFFKQIHEQTII